MLTHWSQNVASVSIFNYRASRMETAESVDDRPNARTRAKRKFEARHGDLPRPMQAPRKFIHRLGIQSSLAEVQRLALIAAPEMIDQLYYLARFAKAENVRVAAANAVLDRAIGRPNQPLDITLDNGQSLPLEDRERLIDLMAQLAGASPLTIDVTPSSTLKKHEKAP